LLVITAHLSIDDAEIKFEFIRSPGPGGQNVNKVATAVLLRFNIPESPSLPLDVRERLLKQLASRLTLKGDLLIKATSFRTQERNKTDALNRLQTILARAAIPPKKRKKTKPTFSSKQRRLDEKKKVSKNKSLRSNKNFDHS
jgi:ribosome-associated protein